MSSTTMPATATATAATTATTSGPGVARGPLSEAGTQAGPRRRWRFARHSLVLARRSLINTLKTPEALIDVTLTPVVFLVLFTYVFGGAISHGSQQDYLQFLLPGVLGQTIAMAGVSIGVNLNTDISKGIFDRFRSLPISRGVPLVGTVLADVVRYVLLFAITFGFGYVLGFRPQTGVPSIAAAGLLAVAFALCMCWASVWVGMTSRTPGAVQGIMVLIVLPLSFGSNAFAPTNTMPGWLQAFVDVNPLTHLIGAMRALLLGGSATADVLWTLLWMAIFLVVFVPLALRAYRRRMV